MMVVFQKGFPLRHIGHLDLMRLFQRALRRSGLPVAYSKGFNPHIEISFASPLGVGVVGMREVADIPVVAGVSENEFLHVLQEQFPLSLQVVRTRFLEDRFPSLMSLVAASCYTIRLPACTETTLVLDGFSGFTGLKDYFVMRKTKKGEKPCNIRTFIQKEDIQSDGDGWKISCVLKSTAEGSLRPSLWFRCLCDYIGIKEYPVLIVRDNILCLDNDGVFVPIEVFNNV